MSVELTFVTVHLGMTTEQQREKVCSQGLTLLALLKKNEPFVIVVVACSGILLHHNLILLTNLVTLQNLLHTHLIFALYRTASVINASCLMMQKSLHPAH